MKISELFKKKKPVVSFEIFPPNPDTELDNILEVIGELSSFCPDFISVTYGAGGMGQNNSLSVASKIKSSFGVEPLLHLTCVNSDKSFIDNTISELKKCKIKNVLALRGDIPSGGRKSYDFMYAKDIISYLTKNGLDCAATCYPEGHIECADFDLNIKHLIQKTESGAQFLISQLFFDNQVFYSFFDDAIKSGVSVPICAGIMPILSKSQIQRMIFMCGASLPSKIIKILYRYENDPDSLIKAGVDYAQNQIYDLIKSGVDGIHIYTMNKPLIAKNCVESIRRAE